MTASPSGTEHRELRELFHEITAGLRAHPKRLPAKLFYDDRGARLFEDITRLDVYYPTRLELAILERCLPEVARKIGPAARVVELGTGSGEKTSMLLDALEEPAGCVPIDIARAQLLEFARELQERHPRMDVRPLPADYTRPLTLPDLERPYGRTVVFFPGSTVGNFEPEEAEAFLRRVISWTGLDAVLLIGVDLRKSRSVLEAAYDDPDHVTAEFNRNALYHLRRLFDGQFDPEAFEHRAVWNADASRVEMHLVCRESQLVRLTSPGGELFEVAVDADEAIVTEHSYKYTLEGFEALCRRAGWVTTRTWTDDRHWFAVRCLEPER